MTDKRQHTIPRVLSDDEIDALLDGDRRKIDRVLMTLMNDTAVALMEFRYQDFPMHAEDEKKLIEAVKDRAEEFHRALGEPKSVSKRAEFIDTLIEEKKARRDMMRHVAKGLALWAVIGFGVFLLTVGKDAVVHWIAEIRSSTPQVKP